MRLFFPFFGRDSAANASLGTALVALCSLLVVATVVALGPSSHDLVTFLVTAGVTTTVALALQRLDWTVLPRWALLLFPLIAVGGLTVASTASSGLGPTYSDFFLLAFVYIGLTQVPGTSTLCAFLALPMWIATEGRLTPAVEVRLPITLLLWVLVGELLSQHVRTSERESGALAEAASTDPLTLLRNRWELEGSLAAMVTGDALVMIDLDRFKNLNDEQGHLAGDRVLADFGRMVVAEMRPGDIGVRYGGDEVLLILREAGLDGTETFLERLRSDWSAPDRPTFSAGVAVHRAGTLPLDTVRRADRALYDAKACGGDGVGFEDEGDDHLPSIPPRLTLVPRAGTPAAGAPAAGRT